MQSRVFMSLLLYSCSTLGLFAAISEFSAALLARGPVIDALLGIIKGEFTARLLFTVLTLYGPVTILSAATPFQDAFG